VNTHAFSRSLAVATVLLAAPALAEQFGPLEVLGFAKEEFSVCDNCSRGLVNPSAFDPRGVLVPASGPMLNQADTTKTRSSNLGLVQLTLGLAHEFDNAIKIEGKASGRERNNGPDVYGNYLIDLYGGISHPKFGSLQVGKFATRSWTRSDSFAYPMGLSVWWAESGAGYGLFPEAVRLGSREYEIELGKIRFEVTAARAKSRQPLNPSASVAPPPSPQALEVFVQYSNEKNLVEVIYQDTTGGRQSSFSKGAFYGAQGDTNGLNTGYRTPTEDLLVVQGTHWFNPTWKLTYGIKRNEWSGQQQQCDYGPVPPKVIGGALVTSACYWDQAGFNYASDKAVHHAIEWDALLGVGYTRQMWTYTLAGVRMNKAYVRTPTEWGQSNTATFINFGIYRKLPELDKHLEVYGGIGRVMFGRQDPAPLSMPSNQANGGWDPRVSKTGNSATIGANFVF
jgi:hypothetical protein